MSSERDGELRAQLNLQGASLSSRIRVCVLYTVYLCAWSQLCRFQCIGTLSANRSKWYQQSGVQN